MWPGVRECAEVHEALHETGPLLDAVARDCEALGAAVARAVAVARSSRAAHLAYTREPGAGAIARDTERACVLAPCATAPRVATSPEPSSSSSSGAKTTVVDVCGSGGMAALAATVAREMLPLRVVDGEPRAQDLAAALAPLLHDPARPALAPVPTTRALAWTVSSGRSSSTTTTAVTLPGLLGATPGPLAWQFYRTAGTVVALLAGAGPGDARRLVRLRVARGTLALTVVAAADVPPSAERLDVGEDRGLALVSCATGQVLVFDLE